MRGPAIPSNDRVLHDLDLVRLLDKLHAASDAQTQGICKHYDERDRAVEELRREAVDLSLAAASKLLGQRLDSETDRKIVQEYLASLDTHH